MTELTYRLLESPEDFTQCEEIQRQTWGPDDVIPATMQKANSHIGGINIGAFDNDGRLVGNAYGATGPFHGELVHWSHMVVVSQDYREQGIGIALKMKQKERCLDKGLTKILWTYDPLEARNGYINFNKLGVSVHDYVEDHYGSGDNNLLLSGLGTDRFIVEWDLLEDLPSPRSKSEFDNLVVIEGPHGTPPFAPPKEALGITLPKNIQELKIVESEEAMAWRMFTRQHIQNQLSNGFKVDFIDRDESGNFTMIFSRKHEN